MIPPALRALARGAARGPLLSRRRPLSSGALHRTRNVGIIAHIDAGKTTTTERMLLLAGVTRSAGEVDSGDTVMDFMDEERKRGITIQAAATSFGWRDHLIHLIDTPGHVDFTIEVERSVRVLDGAVLIVDAVAGSQAQTETVWRQARAHATPAVAFINKMDREGADFHAAVASLEERLRLTAIPAQLPLFEADGSFVGAVDLCSMESIRYRTEAAAKGRPSKLEMRREPISADGAARARDARQALVERVAELEGDGEVTELYLADEPVPAATLHAAIRRLTLSGAGVPVLCGASLHGLGVEALLDAIAAYLPSPAEQPAPLLWPRGHAKASVGIASAPSSPTAEEAEGVALADGARAVALAFKVQHDAHTKKPVVWLRVYGGVIRAGDALLNTRTGEAQKPTRLLRMHGEDAEAIEQVEEGGICAAVGLREARTGDTLLLEPASGCETLQLPSLRIPSPVFFCAVEPDSSGQQAALDKALEALCLEDPSMHTSVDKATGQQLVGGMGELHLEVIASRLRGHFGLDVRVGAMRVAYREGIGAKEVAESEHAVAPAAAEVVKLVLAVEPWRPTPPREARAPAPPPAAARKAGGAGAEGELVDYVRSEEDGVRTAAAAGVRKLLLRREMLALRDGLRAAAQLGPIHGFPLFGASATLLSVHRPRGTSPEALRVAAAEALGEALARAQPHLLEPVMKVELRAPEKFIGSVLSEITGARRGTVVQLSQPTPSGGDQRHLLSAQVPVAGLIGYSTALRSMTAGEASLSMEFSHYAPLDPHTQQQLLLELRGY
ncbi:hypothetical protein AB1Y20_017924 [Prymnesium parvum]|uniref:Tr-type G domain-containing protein n=1 Tax=Prymnesium parvum TaxID=97485 RepID=A0AB34JLL9_PRYPA